MIQRAMLPALILATALVLAACGGGSASPAMIHVHGTVGNSLGGSGTCVSGGDQVKITSASGKVLATPTLGVSPVNKKITTSGITVTVQVYPFSATVPAESRYGITVGSVAPYYVSQEVPDRHASRRACLGGVRALPSSQPAVGCLPEAGPGERADPRNTAACDRCESHGSQYMLFLTNGDTWQCNDPRW